MGKFKFRKDHWMAYVALALAVYLSSGVLITWWVYFTGQAETGQAAGHGLLGRLSLGDVDPLWLILVNTPTLILTVVAIRGYLLSKPNHVLAFLFWGIVLFGLFLLEQPVCFLGLTGLLFFGAGYGQFFKACQKDKMVSDLKDLGVPENEIVAEIPSPNRWSKKVVRNAFIVWLTLAAGFFVYFTYISPYEEECFTDREHCMRVNCIHRHIKRVADPSICEKFEKLHIKHKQTKSPFYVSKAACLDYLYAKDPQNIGMPLETAGLIQQRQLRVSCDPIRLPENREFN